MKNFLLCNPMPSEKVVSWASLILRVLIGVSMLTHGIAKVENFSAIAEGFPDPIYLSHKTSLILAIFAELGCSILLIIGFFTRVSASILIFNMLVIVLVVDKGAPYAAREMGSLYLISYVAIFLLGGAKYSVDYCIGKSCKQKHKAS
ncbi:MAG: DoxX family protein [Chitinophagaceae bacterium]